MEGNPGQSDFIMHQKASAFEKKVILNKLSQMNNLPALSANIMKVMLLLRDENVKLNALVYAIERDQSLTVQLLKLVNSGFYGLRNTVDSVERAVALLGILNIKHLVYSASIINFFSKDEQEEWNHSYSSSVMMTNIIRDNELCGVSNLPMAMLMHDIGKVVLRKFSPLKYQLAVKNSKEEQIPIFAIENGIFQITHAEAGALLLEKWDSVPEIIKPILYHHEENVPPDFVFETALVQFVNWIDSSVRGIVCPPPTKELMTAAGIEEIDTGYWMNYQKNLIEAIDKGQAHSAKTEKLPETAGNPKTSTAAIPRPYDVTQQPVSPVVPDSGSEPHEEDKADVEPDAAPALNGPDSFVFEAGSHAAPKVQEVEDISHEMSPNEELIFRRTFNNKPKPPPIERITQTPEHNVSKAQPPCKPAEPETRTTKILKRPERPPLVPPVKPIE